DRSAAAWPMTMGWIDCLSSGASMGRGIMMAGRWATKGEGEPHPPAECGKRELPFQLPNWALNAFTAKAFNAAFYWKHVRKEWRGVSSPEPFFYPLDAILHWNRAYGSRGFTQYQCVIPRRAGPEGVRSFMRQVVRLGCATPLCVIKDCG